jgi:hypothetical protein
MKRAAALVLLVVAAVGCAGKTGSSRGVVIQRTVEDGGARDHGDFSRPIGQR